MINYLIFTVIGFISGSILYAYWLPLIFCHKDVCELSTDSNPGTANAYKCGGFFIGTSVLIMELLKGCIPVYLASKHTDMASLLFIPVMIAPVAGHAAPFFDTKKAPRRELKKHILFFHLTATPLHDRESSSFQSSKFMRRNIHLSFHRFSMP